VSERVLGYSTEEQKKIKYYTRRGTAGQGMAGRGLARRGWAGQGVAWRGKARQGMEYTINKQST